MPRRPAQPPPTRNGKGVTSVTAALKRYNERFLECRAINHPWTVIGHFRQDGAVIRQLRCPRCGMVRQDYWETSGRRIGNRYHQPEHYAIRGEGQVSPDLVRRETLSRVTVYNSEAEMATAMLKGGRRAAS